MQRCTPCKQPRCAFAAPDGGLENGGVGGGGGEAASNSETGHCHLPLCPLPSSSASSSSASSSTSSPADGCCGLGLHADLPHSSDSSPCCLHHYDDCQARSSDAADNLSINHLPSSILLKVRAHCRFKLAFCLYLLKYFCWFGTINDTKAEMAIDSTHAVYYMLNGFYFLNPPFRCSPT